jgi:hypothetical protein
MQDGNYKPLSHMSLRKTEEFGIFFALLTYPRREEVSIFPYTEHAFTKR